MDQKPFAGKPAAQRNEEGALIHGAHGQITYSNAYG